MDASLGGETNFVAWVALREAQKRSDKKKREDGGATKSKTKVRKDGQTLNGLNRRTGIRNRYYKYDSEYHLAPKCPLKDVSRSESTPYVSFARKVLRPPRPST